MKNCDNCEIEVPCAEDCEQCKRREESQESRESAESNTNKQKLQRIADENFVERIAKMTGCLPSYFVGGNEHIIKQLEQLKTKLISSESQNYCKICGNTLDGYKPKENQGNQKPAEPVETAGKIINKWPKWKQEIRCRPSLVNQEPTEKPIGCYSCQHRNGCTYPESKVGGPCILYLKCQSKEPAEKKDMFVSDARKCLPNLRNKATLIYGKPYYIWIEEACDRLEAAEKRAEKAVKIAERVVDEAAARYEELFKSLVTEVKRAEKAEAEVERLKTLLRCPCGGELEGLGHDIMTKDEVWQCKNCRSQIIIQALKEQKDEGNEQDKTP